MVRTCYELIKRKNPFSLASPLKFKSLAGRDQRGEKGRLVGQQQPWRFKCSSPALLHAENPIIVDHGTDPVGDGDDRAVGSLDQRMDGGLHERVCCWIDGGLRGKERRGGVR